MAARSAIVAGNAAPIPVSSFESLPPEAALPVEWSICRCAGGLALGMLLETRLRTTDEVWGQIL